MQQNHITESASFHWVIKSKYDIISLSLRFWGQWWKQFKTNMPRLSLGHSWEWFHNKEGESGDIPIALFSHWLNGQSQSVFHGITLTNSCHQHKPPWRSYCCQAWTVETVYRYIGWFVRSAPDHRSPLAATTDNFPLASTRYQWCMPYGDQIPVNPRAARKYTGIT